MVRMFTDISQSVEQELIQAVRASNDGYVGWLCDLRDANPEITDAHVDEVAQELWIGTQEGRDCSREYSLEID